MRKSPSLLVPLGVVAAFAVLGASLWALVQALGPQTRLLKDGSRLRLADVSYGRQHVLLERSVWQRLFGAILPSRFPPSYSWSLDTQEPELGFLLVQEVVPPGGEWRGQIAAVDEHGCRIGRAGGKVGLVIASRTRAAGSLAAFPRREGGFRLRLYGSGASQPVAEFGIANPLPGPHPTWSGPALPASQRLGDLEVTLSSLTAGLTWEQLLQSRPRLSDQELAAFMAREGRYRRGWPSIPPPHGAPWTRVSLRVLQRGRPARDWAVEGVTVSDATGNRLHHRTSDAVQCLSSGSDSRGNVWLAFQGALCLQEAAWKVQVHLPYTGPATADRADLRWTLRRVPVPMPATVTPFTATTRQGATLRVRGIYGRRAPWPYGSLGPPRTTRARVEIQRPPGERWLLALRATDGAGRDLGPASRIAYRGAEREWWPEVKLRPGLTRVNLTFTGWKERTPEFLAKPVDAGQ
jgi:hypothetical protein